MFTLPDGTLIEWTETGRVGGPASGSGQYYGRNYLYVRVNGGDWEAQDGFRNLHRLLEWLELCENLQDFMEGIRR